MKTLNQFTTPAFQPAQWEETEDGFLRVGARVLAERVMPYARHEINGLPAEISDDMVNVGVSLDEICCAEALRTLEGAQIVAPDHIWVTPENYTVSKGNTAGAARVVGPYLVIDLMVTDPETIRAIKAREIGEISAGYHADCVFESGEIAGAPCHAKQVGLRFNHIAIIPWSTGRAGQDVRILNSKPTTTEKGDQTMEGKVVRIRLKNSGRFVNTDEEGAAALAAEEGTVAEGGETSAKSLETAMSELEAKSGELAAVQAEVEELKGELSVYKEKLDQLLSTEAVEHAAEEVVAEQGEAEAILENSLPDMKEDDKEKVVNSVKGLRRGALHTAVLNAIGCKTEGMSAEGIKGAFKAQVQLCNMKPGKKVVVGAHVVNQPGADTTGRTAHQKLGFK